jgi:transcriptional regulator with XRE-family HTH domain
MILELPSEGERELTRDEFLQWLEAEMAARDWRPFELAKASGIHQATLGNLLNGTRRLGPDTAVKLARGLGIPPEEVFRKGGLLPDLPGPERDATFREILDVVRNMSVEERREVLEYALYRYRRQKQ